MKFGNLVEICLWPRLAVKGLFNNLYYTEAMACEALYFDFSPPPISRGNTHQYTAISRKVVGKSARDNPEGYCGWF